MSDKDKKQAENEHMENEPTVGEKSDLETQWCPEDRGVYDE